MKLKRLIVGLGLCIAVSAGVARAGDDWVKMATLSPTPGQAKEVAVNRRCSVVRFEITEGSVGFMTFWIREPNGAKTQITVNAAFSKGQKYTHHIDPAREVSGLRISDHGAGSYRVWVK